jgi:hypothetical protein
MNRTWRTVLAMGAAGVLVGCGTTSVPEATDSVEAGSAPVASVGAVATVATNVRYADTAPEGWREPLLDVYAPSGAKDLPLVVLFHGAPTAVDKTGSGLVDYPALAEEIASRGAVVVSANWGLYDAPMPGDAQAFVASVDQGCDETACAISYAAAHAGDWGADPQRLVVIGHSGGATQVSPTVLGEAQPFPGCASDTEWDAKGVVLWEGDMLVEDPSVWPYEDGMADMLAAFTPWGFLDSGFDGAIAFVVSDHSAANPEFQRCDGRAFLDDRDPSGTIEAGLDAIGAFDDGCIDIREESAVTARTMEERGFDTTMVALTDPATTHMGLGDADQAQLADLVMGMAG